VVESPTAALTLRRWVGGACDVLATGGHLLDLPARREGIDLARGFEPTWELVRGKGRTLSDLKRAARRAGRVLLATDPDREGEAIAWQLSIELGAEGGSHRIQRVLFGELTPEAVELAVANPAAIDRARAEAQLARRVIDRLIGFRLSARLSAALRPGLTAGRVQAAALRLAEAWRPPADDEAGPGALASSPPPPYQTSTLLEDAARRLGLRPVRAMALARRLHEGVVLEDGERVGLLTYPRTGSTWLSPEVAKAVGALVTARHGPGALDPGPGPLPPPDGRGVHGALRPARLDWPPERVREALREAGGRDLCRLYALAWERLLGSRMTAEAWRGPGGGGEGGRTRRGTGRELDDAGLLRVLQRRGVGRPSTLASIGESLESRGYLERSAGALRVTPLGGRVLSWLDRTIPHALDADFTARVEARLDEVEAGRLPWRSAVAEAWAPLERVLGRAVA
jgi:DNA topoisomerase-1